MFTIVHCSHIFFSPPHLLDWCIPTFSCTVFSTGGARMLGIYILGPFVVVALGNYVNNNWKHRLSVVHWHGFDTDQYCNQFKKQLAVEIPCTISLSIMWLL